MTQSLSTRLSPNNPAQTVHHVTIHDAACGHIDMLNIKSKYKLGAPLIMSAYPAHIYQCHWTYCSIVTPRAIPDFIKYFHSCYPHLEYAQTTLSIKSTHVYILPLQLNIDLAF